MSPQAFASKVRRRLVRIACRLVQLPRILMYRLLSDTRIQGNPILYQPLQAVGLGVIQFSGQVKIGVFPSPFFFSTYAYIEARNGDARVSIGDDTWISNGFSAIAEHTFISIGQRVLIGTNVEIIDSDFHRIRVSDRKASKAEWARPVMIEDDVFLGSSVRVLKGVTIGRGAVIANGSIAVNDVPKTTVASGNPVCAIKVIE